MLFRDLIVWPISGRELVSVAGGQLDTSQGTKFSTSPYAAVAPHRQDGPSPNSIDYL